MLYPVKPYPEIKEGDLVRFNPKPTVGTKGHEPKWSSTRHAVVDITGNQYFIPSITVEYRTSTLYLIHEFSNI